MEKCIVIEYLEGSLSDGGAETLVKDYVLHLDKEKFEPIVLVDWIFTDCANYKRLKDSGVKIVSIYKSYSIFYRAINKFFREQYIDYKLKRILKSLKPDVIHIHLSALHHIEKIKDSLKDVRLFYTCHSTPSAFFDDDEREEKAANSLIKNNNLRLIALHEDMKEELDRRFSVSNTVVVKNGIDLNRYRHPNLCRKEMREALSISEDAYVIGHVGRFSPEKNHRFIIDVFSLLFDKEPKAFLLLIGSGDKREDIERVIKERGIEDKVKILSSRTDIPELLNAMDVFILPSLYEGLPVSLIEAQAAGKRCVVSENVNPSAFVSNLVVSLSLDDKNKWCDAILGKVNGQGDVDRLEEYDICKEIKNLERLYLGVI
ncbi:MAG: glycosyltransferase [Candidatus Ornithospirochaeta sp.]